MKVRNDALMAALASGDPGLWSAAREDVERPPLANADLAGAVLADFDLSGADLSAADLSGADLTGVDLSGATLEGADLTGARLIDVEVTKASFAGAALDEARVLGVFTQCDFTGSTWEGAKARGAKFVRCDFADAEMDLDDMVRGNRFDGCTFGDREDLPEALRVARPAFLQPPLLEGERVVVSKLQLTFADDAEMRREVIGAATGAGWEPGMLAFLKDGARTYVGLRPQEGVDELEEWLAFEPRAGGGLHAVELVIDPGFETFLEEVVLPLFESASGDLAIRVEQDLEDGSAQVTEIVVDRGRAKPPKQSKRAPA